MEPKKGTIRNIIFDGFEKVIQSETPVLVDFYALWCGPCNSMESILQRIAIEYKEKIGVYKLDTRNYPDVAREQGVKNLPTLILYKRGQAVGEKIQGLQTLDDMREKLDQLLLASAEL